MRSEVRALQTPNQTPNRKMYGPKQARKHMDPDVGARTRHISGTRKCQILMLRWSLVSPKSGAFIPGVLKKKPDRNPKPGKENPEPEHPAASEAGGKQSFKNDRKYGGGTLATAPLGRRNSQAFFAAPRWY